MIIINNDNDNLQYGIRPVVIFPIREVTQHPTKYNLTFRTVLDIILV